MKNFCDNQADVVDKGSEWTERSGGGDWGGGGVSGGPAVVPPADQASDHVNVDC